MVASGVLEQCLSINSTSIDENALLCMSKRFTDLEVAGSAYSANLQQWLLVLAGSLVFFMQCGFAMLCAGCVRKKNLQNTMLKNLLDCCGAAIAYYTVGFGLAFGENDDDKLTFVGTNNFFSRGDFDLSFWFMQFAFTATAVTIVAGTIAERTQMRAYLLYSVLLTAFVYPVIAHAVWSANGFLSAGAARPLGGIGVIDFAGSGVVHVTGGAVAFCAAHVLGARSGRFADAHGKEFSKPRTIPGHSVALQLMGTLVLWFGWYGFNPGSALLLGVDNAGSIAARAAANTSMSAAMGTLSAMFTNLYIQYELTGEYYFNIGMAMNGALSGLVAVTAGCGTIELWAALIIGLISGFVYVGGHHLLDRIKIDDAVDGIPIHLLNGIWAMIATGLFSAPGPTKAAFGSDEHVGWFYSLGRGSGDATLLGNQILCVLFILGWSTAIMYPFFLGLKVIGWYRLDSLNELVGLDRSYHGAVLQDAEEEVQADVEAYEKLRKKMLKRRQQQLRMHSSTTGDTPADQRHNEASTEMMEPPKGIECFPDDDEDSD